MERIYSVKKSTVEFREDDQGNFYPIELSKDKAWYISPTSNEFSHLAEEYLNSSSALIQLNRGMGVSFGAIPAYLALHGLELKLKGALHSIDENKYSVKVLSERKFGHNINNLLMEYHKHFDSLFDQIDHDKKDKIVDVFVAYTSKGYEYLDSEHGDHEGSKLVVDFELIEEVVFKMVDTINSQIYQYFNS